MMNSDLQSVWKMKDSVIIHTQLLNFSGSCMHDVYRWFWNVNGGCLCTCLKTVEMDCHNIISFKIVVLLHETRTNTAI